MSQEKTAVPGMGDGYYSNSNNRLYSRSSTHVNYGITIVVQLYQAWSKWLLEQE